MDGVTTQLAVDPEETGFRSEGIVKDVEVSDAAIVRKTGIHRVQGGLHGSGLDVTGDQCAKIATLIPDKNDLLSSGKKLGYFFFQGLGRDVVAGVENDEVLDAAE